ncbi:MAG TPA: hypothetical protein VJ487_08510 [Alphaproteobacteria bacterium]|nr:hypothetical protein [Alphaproteobacteria bacterium]
MALPARHGLARTAGLAGALILASARTHYDRRKRAASALALAIAPPSQEVPEKALAVIGRIRRRL